MTAKVFVPHEVRRQIEAWYGGPAYEPPREIGSWFLEAARRYFLARRNIESLQSMLPALARMIDRDAEGNVKLALSAERMARRTLKRKRVFPMNRDIKFLETLNRETARRLKIYLPLTPKRIAKMRRETREEARDILRRRKSAFGLRLLEWVKKRAG